MRIPSSTYRVALARLSPLLFGLAVVACGDDPASSTTSSGSGGDIGTGGMSSTGGSGPVMPMGTSLLLQVLDDAGKPIASAAVTVDGTPMPTDGAGYLLLDKLTPGRFSAKVESWGYAPATVVVDLPSGVHGGTEVHLHPLSAPVAFDAAAGAALDQGFVHVTIPSGALVDHKGEPVTGPVEATFVPIDPSADLGTLPGPLEGLAAANGETVSLESLAMAEVSLWQNGLPVELAPGQKATLELVLPDAMAAKTMVGETIPAWWFDLDAGLWREEGVGVVQSSMADPSKLAWVAEVEHFTWWNCDRPWTETNCFDVTVVDSTGHPAPNLAVEATGVDYAGSSTTKITDANGHACVELKLGGTADILVGSTSSPFATKQVTGTGPASTCGGQGAACTPLTISLPADAVGVCVPGESITCAYSGPAGTEGVGICKAATNSCNTTGSGWTGCVGEVLPGTETCNTVFDDDCDGQANEPGAIACACTKGHTISCYTGSPATLGVGLCKAGMRTCGGFPLEYGPCVGEVLPKAETCATPDDDDCDGSSDCSGTSLWSKQFGDDGDHAAGDGIVVDAADDVLISGTFTGTMDFGGGPLTSGAGNDIYLAKLDPNGNHLWSKNFSGYGTKFVQGPAVDAAGNTFIAGDFSGNVDFGGGLITTPSNEAPFLAKFDPNGNHLWSKGFKADGTPGTTAISVDAAGNSLIVVNNMGSVDLGGGWISSFDLPRGFLGKFDPAGNHLWSKRFGDTGAASISGIAFDAAGNVLVAGGFMGTVDFGGGPLTSAGDYDAYITKLDPNGNHLWTKSFGDSLDQSVHAMALDGAGNMLIIGYFHGTVDFGGGPLTSTANGDMYFARFDPNGNHLWSKHFANTGILYSFVLTLDGAANIVLTGYFKDTIDLGGQPLTSVSNSDIFVTKLDPNGNHLWSRRFGAGSQQSRSVAVNGAGNILLTGEFGGTLDFGNGPLTCMGCTKAFVAKLNP